MRRTRGFTDGRNVRADEFSNSCSARDRLPATPGFRPSFVGHILIEMLGCKLRPARSRASNRYYDLLFGFYALDEIADGINPITGKPDRIAFRETLEAVRRSPVHRDYNRRRVADMRLETKSARVDWRKLPEEVPALVAEPAECAQSRAFASARRGDRRAYPVG